MKNTNCFLFSNKKKKRPLLCALSDEHVELQCLTPLHHLSTTPILEMRNQRLSGVSNTPRPYNQYEAEAEYESSHRGFCDHAIPSPLCVGMLETAV